MGGMCVLCPGGVRAFFSGSIYFSLQPHVLADLFFLATPTISVYVLCNLFATF